MSRRPARGSPPAIAIDKSVLANVLAHTEAHNRALQQHDMWRAREKELQLQVTEQPRGDTHEAPAAGRKPDASSSSPPPLPSTTGDDDVMAEFRSLVGDGSGVRPKIDWEAERRASEQMRVDAKRRMDEASATNGGDDRGNQLESSAPSAAQPVAYAGPPRTIADVWSSGRSATTAAAREPKANQDGPAAATAAGERKTNSKKTKRHRSRSRHRSSSSSDSSSDSSDSDSSHGGRARKRTKKHQKRSHSTTTSSDRPTRSRSRERRKSHKKKKSKRRRRSSSSSSSSSESDKDSSSKKRKHKKKRDRGD